MFCKVEGMELTAIIPSDTPLDAAQVKYRVTLTEEERTTLQALLRAGKAAARAQTHARILLKADEAPGGPGWTDERIAEALEVSLSTIARVRWRFLEVGAVAALTPRPRQTAPLTKLDGRAEAHLVALTCSAPPEGHDRWTLRLLTDRFVALGVSEPVSYETVRRVLKKTNSSRGRRSNGVFPRKPAASSSARWKTSSMCMSDDMTPASRWCAWTRPASS
jgi:hypothetical protein